MKIDGVGEVDSDDGDDETLSAVREKLLGIMLKN
jgi:hypothetical protein